MFIILTSGRLAWRKVLMIDTQILTSMCPFPGNQLLAQPRKGLVAHPGEARVAGSGLDLGRVEARQEIPRHRLVRHRHRLEAGSYHDIKKAQKWQK